MEVQVINATENPAEVISRAAGTSYGKDDISLKRVAHCFNNGHMSVFEHVSVTFKISGISRACSHQLVRHRLASYTEKSLRYTKIEGDDWYVTPPVFEGNEYYDEIMKSCLEDYNDAIAACVKPEDARFVLPLATKTEITVTMNLRELLHFLDLRTEKNAQWEIRELAFKMIDSVLDYYAKDKESDDSVINYGLFTRIFHKYIGDTIEY